MTIGSEKGSVQKPFVRYAVVSGWTVKTVSVIKIERNKMKDRFGAQRAKLFGISKTYGL